VIGTSLEVHPFASLPNFTLPSIPRVLLNKACVDGFSRPNDVSVLGDCDDSIWQLCQNLGWDEELRKLHETIGGINRDWKRDGKKTEDGMVEQFNQRIIQGTKIGRGYAEENTPARTKRTRI